MLFATLQTRVPLLLDRPGRNIVALPQLSGTTPNRVASCLHRGSLPFKIRSLTKSTDELYRTRHTRDLAYPRLTTRRSTVETVGPVPVRQGHLLTINMTCRLPERVASLLNVVLQAANLGDDLVPGCLKSTTVPDKVLRPLPLAAPKVEKKTAGPLP